MGNLREPLPRISVQLISNLPDAVIDGERLERPLSTRPPLAHLGPNLGAAWVRLERINDRYGRCAVAFGLFPPGVRAFKGHAAFHRVPEKWEF